MKQEDKDLLLADLCARLSYNVKVIYENKVFSVDYISAKYEEIKLDIPDNYTLNIVEVKPYLFPFSSITEEQLKLFDGTFLPNGHVVASDLGLDYLNSIHVDYRGLIPKGLAIDATNLNIY